MKKSLLPIMYLLLLGISLAQAQRDPLRWPFNKYSIWNVPIHNNATYVFANVQPAERHEADEDIIIMTPTAPIMNVETNYTGWSGGGSARCPDQGPTLFSAPIPQSFIYSNSNWTGNTPNAGAAILLANGTIKQTQPFAKCSNTVATSLFQWNENNCVLTGECIVGAHGGSHLSAIGGTLRVGEFTAGAIKHVLKINLYGRENFYNGDGGYRWPATTADGGYDNPSSGNYYGGSNPEMRIGALLALHKTAVLNSVNDNSLGIETLPGLILARALRDYGAYTVDNTAWDTYAIITEHGPNGTVRNEFQNLYGYSINQGGFLDDTPWARDLDRLFRNLYVISNNGPGNIGGGPTTDANRRAPFACDIGPQGSGAMCGGTVAVTSVNVSPSATSVVSGSTISLTANVLPSNASNKTVSWSSGNTAVATVNSSGLVSGVSVGNTTITVTTQDGNKTATSSITVTAAPGGGAPLAGTSIGTAGSYNNGGNTFSKALDGNLSTFFDGPSADGIWVGLDLGTAKAIAQVKYAPRVSWAGRMNGGRFQGSNSPTFNPATDFFTVQGSPSENVLTVVNINHSATFRYVRYLAPNGAYGNISELEFWGNGSGTVAVTGVVVNPASVNIAMDSATSLAATVSPSNASNKTISWSSANPSVATVDQAGIVRAVAAGSTTITVTTQEGGFTATSAITVTTTPGNLFTTNPGFESTTGTHFPHGVYNGIKGWTLNNTAYNSIGVSSGGAYEGNNKLSLVYGGRAETAVGNMAAVTAGQIYTLRLAISKTSNTNTSIQSPIFFRINWYNSANSLLGSTSSGNILGGGTTGWAEFSVTGTAPSGAVKASCYIELINTTYPNHDVARFSVDKAVVIQGGGAARMETAPTVLRWAEEEPGNELVVYPVPVKGEFTIELKGFTNPVVRIADMMNRDVLVQKVSTDKLTVSQKFTKGMYIISVRDLTHKRSKKIIIE